MTDHAKRSRAEQAADTLRGYLADGTWPVGSRIPTETELAELLGVGRNSVREAVQSLAHAGLLVKRQGSGTYVQTASELPTALGRRVFESSLRDAMEVRRALEVEAARLAALRRTDQEAAALEQLVADRAAAFESHDLSAMVAADLDLHRTILTASRNTLLSELFESMIEPISATIRANLTLEPIPALADDHDVMVQAIVNKDPDGAIQASVRSFEHYSGKRTQTTP